jgi:hypothetical protein
VNLGSSSGAGAFFSDNACTVGTSSVTILTTGNSAGFYYKDGAAGSPHTFLN